MKIKKTNAMRILEQKKINYNMITYDNNDGKIDGMSVAKKIGKEPDVVYKTLVVKGNSKNIYVFIVPVNTELDLKKAAKAAGEKKVELVSVKDILKLTGYIRGGCSPIGMKKHYKTFIDLSALNIEKIIVSGGKIGIQIELEVDELAKVTGAEFVDIIK
ncbi:Cys-tRNA(Pro)/Cys-tRNA(Cys) deacylase [Caminicella sporogenes DSM 14501]|uniref:Cys-tRNA(Pro)/Cys-tRNA(Cys) deacylase n=1 Tax=Caminicella sporogenes DSM 14501 TaxID=1121266 RepID=A0A1M6PD32_9FIRM|nr:Cys-tRNA(Pro) deacylase [Caminicella sporogenes]RKD21447.1 aminoacyl-tRNA deacylase [Caminicella sporogenes]SHK05790.1 Cys-tRNA(Pro)/Cys-tRNA(Cys) deacylase [Caminicella sporogenes DSM 14501]